MGGMSTFLIKYGLIIGKFANILCLCGGLKKLGLGKNGGSASGAELVNLQLTPSGNIALDISLLTWLLICYSELVKSVLLRSTCHELLVKSDTSRVICQESHVIINMA